jgi:aryl-alcohol dehydrogenase-like predicted oxidoreductase
VDHVTLAGGVQLPRVIKGGWQLAGGHGPIDRAQAVRDMFAYAESGITTFDCADIYTGVEALIGEFLREWRAVHPSRADAIRVHTKFVPDRGALAALTALDVDRAIDRSRARLGVDRLDLVQLHWWDYDAPGLVRTAERLAELRHAGALRDIGVTNFDTPHLLELLAAGVPVLTHQLQYSLLDRRPAQAMTGVCREHGVGFLCYGALAGGFLSERWLGRAEPEEPLENRSLTKYKLIIDELGGWVLFQELLATLSAIASRHGSRIGAVAIRWALLQPNVASVITGVRTATHLASTLTAPSLPLDDEDLSRIGAILARASGPSGDVYALEREKGGRHAAIMRYDLNTRSEPSTF